jgi:murein DD-endopeptidase MepM/ murein hydrolase activator NlpD
MEDRRVNSRSWLIASFIFGLIATLLPGPAAAQSVETLGVQAFLAAQPGALQTMRDGERTAATIIEGNSLYYGLSPRLLLALLEAAGALLSDPAPAPETLERPFSPTGPQGFGAQIEWAARELRAGLGPYERPPTLHFTDGTTITLTLEQAPEGVAVQRFLARGRTQPEWRTAVAAFGAAFERYFNNELVQVGIGAPARPADAPTTGFLFQPWPAGTRVVHLAYFDHMYPTVDSGIPGNGFVVNYLGRSNVQYDGHDGHDYYFPDQPIGTPILAAAPGTAYARTQRGNGVVIVHPGGYETVYWHLDAFAPIFDGLVDSSNGVFVPAGAFIGTSGTSGFVRGTPHLHFEVRRYGKQIDPYGWFGAGPDPCAAYAGCLPGEWLWHSSLSGIDHFTPPRTSPAPLPLDDTTPPVGTLTVEPPADLRFHATFDGHAVQRVGQGFPELAGTLTFNAGRAGQAVRLNSAGLAYPTSDNLDPAAGTIALWVELPERYPANSLQRHYLFAASANADGAPVYSGTLALRRDMLGPGDTPQWSFWTNGSDLESRDLLAVPDTLGPGWHHFAVTWDGVSGAKALYINGNQVAATTGAILPTAVGPVLQLGRFTYGGAPAGVALDSLTIFDRPLAAAEITALAATPPEEAGPPTLRSRSFRLDTNAIDDAGGIVAVQLGLNGVFADPQPYYDSYRWRLPEEEGEHEVAVRYFDRAGNSTTVTQTVVLDLPPRAQIALEPLQRSALLTISANDAHGPIEMQISQQADFDTAQWSPMREQVFWAWDPNLPAQVFVRLRDANGNVSAPSRVSVSGGTVYLPLIGARSP